MTRHISRMSEEQREADRAQKLQQRLLRREELDLTVTRDFLRGKISFSAISKGTSQGARVDRAYPRLDKMLVAWTLILANPTPFDFKVVEDGLIGNLSSALYIIYPDDPYINDTSLNNGLHVRHMTRAVKATPSVALVALVYDHIGRANGGIAEYFKSRDLEPPTEFDMEVMEAVCTPDALPARQEDATPKGHGSKAGANPHIEAVAQRALQELRELYSPLVLARLKRLL